MRTPKVLIYKYTCILDYISVYTNSTNGDVSVYSSWITRSIRTSPFCFCLLADKLTADIFFVSKE